MYVTFLNADNCLSPKTQCYILSNVGTTQNHFQIHENHPQIQKKYLYQKHFEVCRTGALHPSSNTEFGNIGLSYVLVTEAILLLLRRILLCNHFQKFIRPHCSWLSCLSPLLEGYLHSSDASKSSLFQPKFIYGQFIAICSCTSIVL